MKVTVIPITFGAFGTVPHRPRKETGGTGDQTMDQGHPDHNTAEIS